jgi:hypothetical protein
VVLRRKAAVEGLPFDSNVAAIARVTDDRVDQMLERRARPDPVVRGPDTRDLRRRRRGPTGCEYRGSNVLTDVADPDVPALRSRRHSPQRGELGTESGCKSVVNVVETDRVRGCRVHVTPEHARSAVI